MKLSISWMSNLIDFYWIEERVSFYRLSSTIKFVEIKMKFVCFLVIREFVRCVLCLAIICKSSKKWNDFSFISSSILLQIVHKYLQHKKILRFDFVELFCAISKFLFRYGRWGKNEVEVRGSSNAFKYLLIVSFEIRVEILTLLPETFRSTTRQKLLNLTISIDIVRETLKSVLFISLWRCFMGQFLLATSSSF